MHGTQAGDMWTARLLVCYLHCVYATSVNISTETKHIFIIEEENNWWDARKNCKMAPKRDLYREFPPPGVDENLHSNTSYWVGAMRYSSWIWTEDGTPLYTYDGYNTTQGRSPKTNLSYNSVFECHLRCPSNRIVGLSGQRCYCLGNATSVTNTSAGGMQCPGNPDEMCGNDDVMSVYTLGNFSFKPTRTGVCAYAEKKETTISIKPDNYYKCVTKRRRFAYYSHNTQNCNGSVCASAENNSQLWINANNSNDLIKLNSSTARDFPNIPGHHKFWIGLVLHISKKWIDGQGVNGTEEYFPLINLPTTTCLAMKNNDGIWMPYWIPCKLRLASICEAKKEISQSTSTLTSTSTSTPSSTQSPSSGGDSTVAPSHPSAVKKSHAFVQASSQRGIIIGLAIGNAVFLLIVIGLVFLLQRERKLRLDRKDTNQQVNLNPPTENTTYDGFDVPRDNGAYSVITPDTIDGKPFIPPVPTATVNQNTHTAKFYVNHPETDIEKVSNSLSTPSKQHTDMPRGKPHIYLSGPDYDRAECILQYRSGDGGDTGLDRSAGSTGVAISEGVQYHILEKRSSTGRDKSDAGLYEPTEAAEGNYDTTHQGGKARNVDDSYSHIGAINKGFIEGDYDVAGAGPIVIRLDDTYNHAYETTYKATD